MKIAQSDQTSEPKRVHMSLEDVVRELAASLRDAIEQTTPSIQDPEDTFTDLACRLMFQLRGKLMIVQETDVEERNRAAYADAAQRIFNIFTDWMHAHPKCSYDTRISVTGKFQVVVKTPEGVQLFFGENVQDAYAQAAMTLYADDYLDEGVL